MSSRAARKTDVGKATLIGFICLMLIYVGASVLPYGTLSSAEVAALDYPALVYVFSSMAPGWGGPFISIAISISILALAVFHHPARRDDFRNGRLQAAAGLVGQAEQP